MILQVVADTRQVLDRRDAELAECVRIAHAGQHEELWRVEGAAAHDHLAACAHLPHGAAAQIPQPDRAAALEHDLRRERACAERQVRPTRSRAQIGIRRARPPALVNGRLRQAEAVGLRPVQILGFWIAGGPCSLQHRPAERIAAAGVGDADRPLRPAMGRGTLAPALQAFEIGQQLLIGPRAQAEPDPSRIVAAVATIVRHEVDGGGSAQHLAALQLDTAPVQAWLRLARIVPVEQAGPANMANAQRDMDGGVPVAPARFQQQHADIGVLAQPGGQHAAG